MVRSHKVRGFALRDVVALVGIGIVSIILGMPALAQWRYLSRREQCTMNLKGIGTSLKIYANDNNERWAVPAFKRAAIDAGGIDYLASDRVNDPPIEPGDVGYERATESTAETAQYPNVGSTALSVTRAFWMLARSGDVTVAQFVCPSTRDVPDPSGSGLWDPSVGNYYDFTGYDNISYGYQVPFGPRDTQAREGADNRQVFAADKGPYYLNTFVPTFQTRGHQPVMFDDPPFRWRPYNSPNHFGFGQNVLYADGHAAFVEKPTAGVNGDNIYTVMVDGWDETGFNRIHGESPHYATAAPYPYPGQNVFGVGPSLYAATDSLLYP